MDKAKKILIVEDDQSLQKIIQINLENNGYATVVASDGEDGLKKAQSESPDLILLDMVMPVMGGKEMLEKMRQTDWGKDILVVVLTNSQNATTISDSLSLKIAGYVVKSDIKIEDIGNIVKTII
jgi:CheY-like chemotaxis protein